MKQSVPSIFLSYCWSNSAFADEIDRHFDAIGITFKRDIRDLKYKMNIREFMQSISSQDYVVLLISNEYLRSSNCMYEVLETISDENNQTKILPVILPDTKLFSPNDKLDLIKYWNTKIQELENSITELQSSKIDSVYETIDHFTNIVNTVDKFTDYLTSINCMSFEELRSQNYIPMIEYTGFVQTELIIELLEIDKTEDEDEQDLLIERFLKKHKNHKYGLFIKAFLFLQRKKYKAAQFSYETLLNLHPDFVEALNDYSCTMDFGFHDFQKSNELLAHALKVDPDNYLVQTNYGINCLKVGNKELAKIHLEIALNLNFSYFLAHYGMALFLIETSGNTDTTKEHLEKAIYLNSNFLDAYISYSVLLINDLNLFDIAKANLEDALKIGPDNFKLNLLYATLLYTNFREYDLSKTHFEKALLLDNNDEIVHLNYSALLINYYKDYTNAKNHLSKAIELNPKNENALLNYAVLLFEKFGDYSSLREYLDQKFNLKTASFEELLTYGSLLFKQSREHELAKKVLLLAKEINSNHYELNLLLGQLECVVFENFELARDYFQKALVINPDSTEANMYLATILMTIFSDYEEAEIPIKKLLAKDSKHLQANLFQGQIHMSREDYPKAKIIYEFLVDEFPDNEAANYMYVFVLGYYNQFEDAKKHYYKAIQLNPILKNSEIENMLGI